jgi:hypothetical protein
MQSNRWKACLGRGGGPCKCCAVGLVYRCLQRRLNSAPHHMIYMTESWLHCAAGQTHCESAPPAAGPLRPQGQPFAVPTAPLPRTASPPRSFREQENAAAVPAPSASSPKKASGPGQSLEMLINYKWASKIAWRSTNPLRMGAVG